MIANKPFFKLDETPPPLLELWLTQVPLKSDKIRERIQAGRTSRELSFDDQQLAMTIETPQITRISGVARNG